MKTKNFLTLLLLAVTTCLPAWADTEYVLIKNDNTINTEDFIVMENCSIFVEDVTLGSTTYPAYIQLKAGTGGVTTPKNVGADNLIRYDAKTTITEVEMVAYNTSTGNNRNFVYTVIAEGDTDCEPQKIQVNKNGAYISETRTSTSTKNRSIYFSASDNADVKIVKIKVTEKGDAIPQAGAADWSATFNKGRFTDLSKKGSFLDGMKIVPQGEYKALQTTSVQLRDEGTFMKFTAPQDVKLTVHTDNAGVNNVRYFYVTTNLGNTTPSATCFKTLCPQSGEEATSSFDYILSAGTWFIRSEYGKTLSFTQLDFTALAAKYDVKFIVDGDQVGETQKVTDGEYATAPSTDPTKAGYKFKGWSTDGTEENIKTVASYAITANTDFTAVWEEATTCEVSFNSKGGSDVASLYVIENEYITAAPANPTKAGYAFQGWSETDGGAVVDITTIAITAAKTYYAVWTNDVFTLTVGTTTATDMNNNERAMTSTEAIVVGGAGFVGCTQEADKGVFGVNRILLGGDQAYVKITLTNDLREGDVVKFANNYSDTHEYALTYTRARNTTIHTANLEYPIPAGSPLIGRQVLYIWRYTSNQAATINTIRVVRPENSVANEFVYVSFDSDGATTGDPATQKLLKNTWKPETPETPVRGTDLFQGWFESGASEAFDFNQTLAADVALTAHWQTANSKTVRFFSQGAQIGSDLQILENQLVSPVPANPTRTGYNFKGWSTDGTDNNIQNLAEYLVQDDVDFTAVWHKIIVVTTDVNGTLSEFNYEENEYANLTSPSRSGYLFAGWKKQGEADLYDFSTALTEDITFVAQWTEANPNEFVYAFNDAFHYDGFSYKSPEGLAFVQNPAEDERPFSANPYTIFASDGGITSIVVNDGRFNPRDRTAYAIAFISPQIKMATTSSIVFTVKDGYEATLTLTASGYNDTRTVNLTDATPASQISEGRADWNTSGTMTFVMGAGEHILTVAAYTLFVKGFTFTTSLADQDVKLADLQIDGVTMDGFSPLVDEYDALIPYAAASLPVVTYTASDPANVTVTECWYPVGTDSYDYVATVTSNIDPTASRTYTIHFTPGTKDKLVIVRGDYVTNNTCTVTGKYKDEANTTMNANAGDVGGGYKFYTNYTHKIHLAITGATFHEGDLLRIYITKQRDNANTTLTVYGDADGTDIVYATGLVGEVGLNTIALPAEAEGRTDLYLMRVDGNTWNPYIRYAEVVRTLDEPVITSFSLAGTAGVIDQTNKTINVELPAFTSYVQTPVITTENNSPTFVTVVTPDGEQDFSSPVVYTLTDKDGDQNTYTVNVTTLIEIGNADNSAVLAAYNGKKVNVNFTRPIDASNGDWYTLCLPFNLSAEQIAAAFGPCQLATLATSEWLPEYNLARIRHTHVSAIEAGVPYLFLPENSISDDVTIPGVTIDNTLRPVNTAYVDYVGTFNPIALADDGYTFYLDDNNMLYHPWENMTLRATRCYYHFHNLTPAQMQNIMARVMIDGDANHTPTTVEQITADPTINGKYILNGQLIIIRDGVEYNAQGQVIK